MPRQAFEMAFAPVVLKELITEAGIVQSRLAEEVSAEMRFPVSRSTINLAVNRGYEPVTLPGLRAAVETVLSKNPRAAAFLEARGLEMKDIWNPLGRGMRLARPVGGAARRAAGAAPPSIEPVNHVMEAQMISQEALRHFKLFRNPFLDDIQKDQDIYMSDEHRYIEAAMLDAARHGGFLAVIGEVGSGKSVIRRKVVEQLRRDGDVLVIYPQMIDKTRLNASSVCDAVIQDVSSEKCKSKLEDKTRQVQRLLQDRSKAGYRHVLVVEEAHDLKIQTLKYLKRFHELEDGYRKLLGIILIGQTELKHLFNEGQNVDMREVIRRVQVAEIRGLNGNLKDYLALKFKRAGKSLDEVFAGDAFEAIGKRLTSTGRDGRSKISHAYPLLVNNYVARAMNTAAELGELRISAEVVMAL